MDQKMRHEATKDTKDTKKASNESKGCHCMKAVKLERSSFVFFVPSW